MSEKAVEQKLTQAERSTFESIIQAAKDDNLMLVRSALNGDAIAVLAVATKDEGSEGVQVFPVALLVTDKIFSELADPTEEDAG